MRASISVVIPVASKHLDVLSWQLHSLAKQEDAPTHEIIVADASGTLGPDALHGVTTVDASAAIGAGAVRNVGAKAASAALLAFCDADDIVAPSWLAGHYAALQNAGFTGGPVIRIQRPNQPGVSEPRALPSTRRQLPRHEGVDIVDSANMAIRRDLFEAVGGFDERYLRAQDVAFSLRLRQADVEPYFVESALVWVTDERRGRAKRRVRYLSGVSFMRLRRDFGLPGSLWRDLARPLKGVWRSSGSVLARSFTRTGAGPYHGASRPTSYTFAFSLGAAAEFILPGRADAAMRLHLRAGGPAKLSGRSPSPE